MKKILLVIIIGFTSIVCKKNDNINATGVKKLELLKSYSLDIKEPSGLTMDLSRKYLWVVSNNTNQIFKISLSGQIIKKLPFLGNKLEGIAQNPIDGSLWIVEEVERKIIKLDTLGNVILNKAIDYPGEPNSGFEGITYNFDNNDILVVNEKKPAAILKFDKNLNLISVNEISITTDISGIDYEPIEKNIWIVSDESMLVAKFDFNNKILAEFEIGVNKEEGIVVDILNNLIYLVSDSGNRLDVYSIPK